MGTGSVEPRFTNVLRQRDSRPRYLYRVILPDGRGYIGVSINPKLRFRVHSSPSTRSFIGEAIRHYGRQACRLEILCAGSCDYMYQLERHAIAAFRTRYPAGYNLDAGGIIPQHLPGSVAKNVESNEDSLLRKRAEFRTNGISRAEAILCRRHKILLPSTKLKSSDLTFWSRAAVAMMNVRPSADGRCDCCSEIVGVDQLLPDHDFLGGTGWICPACKGFGFFHLKRRTLEDWLAAFRR
jgi:hypothetical protein